MMSLSPPRPSCVPSVSLGYQLCLSPGHGILLLPITGFSGITQAKPQIIVMTTMDQIQMLVPMKLSQLGPRHPPQLSCCQEGPRID